MGNDSETEIEKIAIISYQIVLDAKYHRKFELRNLCENLLNWYPSNQPQCLAPDKTS